MFQGWWKKWLGQGRPARGGGRGRTGPMRSPPPSVESLEDRVLLSAGLFLDINQTTASAFPSPPADTRGAVLGGALYFAASDGGDGMALWKSDGTARGTM